MLLQKVNVPSLVVISLQTSVWPCNYFCFNFSYVTCPFITVFSIWVNRAVKKIIYSLKGKINSSGKLLICGLFWIAITIITTFKEKMGNAYELFSSVKNHWIEKARLPIIRVLLFRLSSWFCQVFVLFYCLWMETNWFSVFGFSKNLFRISILEKKRNKMRKCLL